MNIVDIWKKYNIDTDERVAFAEFIKKSQYNYTQSFLWGIDIDDSEDIGSIVAEFRSGFSKRFITISESNTATVPEVTQSKLIECPDCGKQVSRRAQACIHCGCPMDVVVEAAPKQYYGVKELSRKLIVGTPSTFISRVWVLNKQETKVKDTTILACGISKDRAELLLDYFTAHGGTGELVLDTQCTQENKLVTRYLDATINPNAPVVCPRCHSTEVRIGQRGYNVVSGFVGSSKTTNRCGKCGYTWSPESLMK